MKTYVPIQASVSILPSLNYYCIKDECSEIDLDYKRFENGKIQTNTLVKNKQNLH